MSPSFRPASRARCAGVLAAAVLVAAGCGAAPDSGESSKPTDVATTDLAAGQQIEWCPDIRVPSRVNSGPLSDAESAFQDARTAVAEDHRNDPTWAESYIVWPENGIVFLFTDSDPEREQAIRDRLAPYTDNVDFKIVDYPYAELLETAELISDRRPPSADPDVVIRGWGPSVILNRVTIALSDLDAAATLTERFDLPEPYDMLCILPYVPEPEYSIEGQPIEQTP